MKDTGRRLLETFDFVQIINLKSRPDRLREMSAQLRRIGLSLDHPQIAVLEASSFSEPAGFPSVGARGCFDSHVRALETAQARGCRNTLILEDDCNFVRDLESRLPPALDTLDQAPWSIFYGSLFEWDGFGSLPSPLANLDPSIWLTGAHFVAFSAEAIGLAIPYLRAIPTRQPGSFEGGPMHLDGAYNWFRSAHPQLTTWAAVPVLGYQRPSRTDIHELRFYDKAPVVRDLVAFTRRLRAVG